MYVQLPAYAVSEVRFAPAEGVLVTIVGLAALTVLTILAGLLADRYSRRRLGLAAALVLAIVAIPSFIAIRDNDGSILPAIIAVLAMTVPYVIINAVTHSVIFDLLATKRRSTAYSIAWESR